MAYITVEDIRNEGVSESQYTNAKVEKRIALAQALIEKLTGRFFEKRTAITLSMDGTGHALLWLPITPTSVDSITSVTISDEEVDVEDYEVLMPTYPDGRFNPKLRKLSGVWTKGMSNIKVVGDFGFVEADESTPIDIKDLCIRIVIWGISDRGSAEGGRSHRIVEETIENYRYRLSEASNTGLFNDSYIDGLLSDYAKKDMAVI